MIQCIKKLYQYFRHKTPIELGVEGELSKIREEFDELTDAYNQQKSIFTIIESSDLIDTVGMFTWKQYKIPLWSVIILVYIRKVYKFFRNPILHRIYGKREKIFGINSTQ